jgi:hypothetical protein
LTLRSSAKGKKRASAFHIVLDLYMCRSTESTAKLRKDEKSTGCSPGLLREGNVVYGLHGVVFSKKSTERGKGGSEGGLDDLWAAVDKDVHLAARGNPALETVG